MPNIGGINALWPQPKYWESVAPWPLYRPPWSSEIFLRLWLTQIKNKLTGFYPYIPVAGGLSLRQVKNTGNVFLFTYIKCDMSCDGLIFCRATRMHSAGYPVARCLSVRLSVCYTPVLSLNISSRKVFPPSGSPTILVFTARCDASAVFAVMQCLSVRLSVTFVDHVKTNKDIFEIFFTIG